jgi:MoaA/NifB/PqqE/SkfB family radical SAM enzyme
MSTNKTYCALPFRETMMLPGDVLLLCCRHDTNVVIKEDFDKTFKSGKLQEIRELMLAGKPVSGCEQCYREEHQGVESMREQSIKTYGIVDDIELQGLHIQFDNICNLKCRMCSSVSSHLLHSEETEIYGKAISWKKFVVADKYKQMDISKLTTIRLHGGEPFMSKRAEEFCKSITELGRIDKVSIVIPTNGMIRPSNDFLEALSNCNSLSIAVSIDALGGLNDYFRSKSDFDTIISNLDFFYSLIKSRKAGTTNISVVTTVNIYNVNKLQELDLFLKSRYSNLTLTKSMLHGPEYLRISCLPKEYKDRIRHTVAEYPDVLRMLDIEDTNYFEEFVFNHRQLDNIRQESLDDFNLELSEFISNYKFIKEVTLEQIIKFHNFVDPGVFND